MGLEKLSARNIDNPSETGDGVDKKEAVEHLRDLRNLFTPFISDYVNDVKNSQITKKDFESLKLGDYKGEFLKTDLISFLYDFEDLKASREDIEEIEEWRWLDEEDTSGTSQSEIESRFRRIRKILKIYNLDPNNLSESQKTYLFYASYNTEELRDLPQQGWWLDKRISQDYVEGIILGKPMIDDEKENIFPPVVTIPVGEYGPELAVKIYNVVQILLSKTTILKEKSIEMVKAHEDLFAKTARGSDAKVLEDMGLAAYKTMQEGIVTLGQAIATLTLEKVPGYEDDPDRLIEDLLFKQLPNKLAYLAPPAYIGPFSLAGVMIKGLMQKNGQGELTLNPDILDVFAASKNQVVLNLSVNEVHKNFMPAGGRGCPVSFKGQEIKQSGVNELSGVFLEIYKDNFTNS